MKLYGVDKSRSICRQVLRNKWLKRNLHQLNQFRFENGLETFDAKNVEIFLWQSLYNQTA